MAKLALSATDLEQIKKARTHMVLNEVDAGRIESSRGTIFVGCPDADQFQDVFEHHCAACNGDIRHHPLGLNGGALLLSKHSPIPFASCDGSVLLRHIKTAAAIKGINSIALYVHAPCGVAKAAGLDTVEVLRLLMEAKARLLRQHDCRDLKFHCFMHVDYAARKRTYHVNRLNALKFLQEHQRPARA